MMTRTLQKVHIRKVKKSSSRKKSRNCSSIETKYMEREPSMKMSPQMNAQAVRMKRKKNPKCMRNKMNQPRKVMKVNSRILELIIANLN